MLKEVKHSWDFNIVKNSVDGINVYYNLKFNQVQLCSDINVHIVILSPSKVTVLWL